METCPNCRGELTWAADEPRPEVCASCRAAGAVGVASKAARMFAEAEASAVAAEIIARPAAVAAGAASEPVMPVSAPEPPAKPPPVAPVWVPPSSAQVPALADRYSPVAVASPVPVAVASPVPVAVASPVPAAVDAPAAPRPYAPALDSPSAVRPPEPPPGYELLGLLGRGGMGVVYKARQIKHNRIVALKTLFVGGTPEQADSDGLRAEAEQLGRLAHPNIVAVYDVGEHSDRPYLALEYIGGGCLEDLIARGRMPVRKAVELIEVLARAMHAVHLRGVIHRDIKPGNILMTEDGVPKITDFGLAKYMEARNSTTRTGIVKGTPNYMSPEQATGNSKRVGPYTDVYGLGAMLYELLTGVPPFDGPNALATILQVASDEPKPLRALVPDLPAELETICLKCLRKQPADRYTSAELFADDLRRFLDGVPVVARPETSVQKLRGWVNRNSTILAMMMLTAAAAALAAGIVVWLMRSGRI